MKKNSAEDKRRREQKMIQEMIFLYCRKHHGSRREICPDCLRLQNYALERIARCPFMAVKTFCSSCKVHCYAPEMREKIRSVMRWAGPRMLLYHPALAFRHLAATRKETTA